MVHSPVHSRAIAVAVLLSSSPLSRYKSRWRPVCRSNRRRTLKLSRGLTLVKIMSSVLPFRSRSDIGHREVIEHGPQNAGFPDQCPHTAFLKRISCRVLNHEFDGLIRIESCASDTQLKILQRLRAHPGIVLFPCFETP